MDLSRAFDLNRAISHGAQGLQRAPGPLFVGGFLVWATGNSTSGINVNATDLGRFGERWGEGSSDPYSFDWGGDPEVTRGLMELLADGDPLALLAGVLGALLCSLAVAIFFLSLHSWLQVGWLRAHRALIVTGATDYSPLFSGGDRFWDMLLWQVLRGVIVLGTTAVAAAPGMGLALMGYQLEQPLLLPLAGFVTLILAAPAAIYVALGLMLGSCALVLEGLSPMEALDRSWTLASGNRATLLVYSLVMGLVNAAGAAVGALFLCVGAFVFGPMAFAVTELGLTECFLIAVEGEEAAQDWALVRELGGL